jgi:predicted exporter
MKQKINYFILLLLLLSAYILKDSIHISTNLLSLFAPKEALGRLAIANELGYSKEMFIAVKGFTKESKKELKSIARELKSLDGIKEVVYTTRPDKSVQNYFREYYPVLADFDARKLSDAEIQNRLKELYKSTQKSLFYTPINRRDPLGLFKMSQDPLFASHKGRYLCLNNYGYLIKVSTDISPSEMSKAEKLYKDVQKVLLKYKNVVAFAGFFYTVENSAKIKADVERIVLLSTIMLLIIYFVMLRSLRLLLHTTIALVSSMIFAALICTTTMENFGVLSLAFGTSLTAVSIDYFFHYYFHNFYQSGKTFDKSVFFGYLTTISAFGIFAFIDLPMLSQISIFALLSLSFAYILFTFVFPYLDIAPYEYKGEQRYFSLRVPAYLITIFSLGVLLYSMDVMHFNDNIATLDYQNKKLQKAQALFSSAQGEKLYPILVEAPTTEMLIARLHTIKKHTKRSLSLANFVPENQFCKQREAEIARYGFEKLRERTERISEQLGFKKGYFNDAYRFVQKPRSCSDIELDIFHKYNLSVYRGSKGIYTIAFVDSLKSIDGLSYAGAIDAKAIFAKVANAMFDEVLFYALIVICVIMLLLFVSVRERFFYALNYVLFPLALTLGVIVTFDTLNIMHLFALIILIAIGIDYGIYMSNTQKASRTMLAIRYSLLSTFAAFGVLMFSSIVALNSIGVVITLGCLAIYILIKGMR